MGAMIKENKEFLISEKSDDLKSRIRLAKSKVEIKNEDGVRRTRYINDNVSLEKTGIL